MTLVELDEAALASLEFVVDRVRPDQARRRTPCADWTVSDLLEHLVAVNVRYAAVGRGEPLRSGVVPVDLSGGAAGAFRDSRAAFVTAWRTFGVLDRIVEVPEGTAPAAMVVSMHLREVLVHGWDLAAATGQPADFPDDAVRSSLEQARATMPVSRPAGGGFDDATPVADDAPPIVALAAFFGRDVAAWS